MTDPRAGNGQAAPVGRTLPDWLAYVESVHPRAWDLGLDRVRRVAERLELLPPAPLNVVVGGTNGKGSTSVYAEALLRASGLSVGTTLSPHLHAFNERIRVDGLPVDDAVVVEAFEAVDAARGPVTLTYFEFGVLAALRVFRRARVDATVLEVGLGGRLDAVNIVDGQVTVITSIGLDHQDYLGDDLESIGAEKAGILRAGVPCVYGAPGPPASIASRAAGLGAPLLERERDFAFAADPDTATWALRGRDRSGPVVLKGLTLPAVALENAAAALQATLLLGPVAAADARALCERASSARLPGRFEQRRVGSVDVVLDVAHNPHGAAFLADLLRRAPVAGATLAVMGCLKDKDAAGIVAALDAVVDEWTFVDSGTSRGQTGTETLAKVGPTVGGSARTDVESALGDVIGRAAGSDRVLVLGSFDVVRRAREWLECRP